MEKSPVIRAHAHVSKAHKILAIRNAPTTDEIRSAAKEHQRASELFLEATKTTRNEEALRTLVLLSKQHKLRAEALHSIAARTSAPPAPTEDAAKTDSTPQSSSGTPSPPQGTAASTTATRTSRLPSLATTLASARGIPPNPPSRSNSGHEEHNFLSNVNGFMGLLRSPLAGPLGFAGLPLTGNAANNPNLANLVPKNHPLPTQIAGSAVPNRGIAESFYVVPPTGGTVPYADMLRRGTEAALAAPSKPGSLENSTVLRPPDDSAGAADIAAENARLREMLIKAKRDEEEWRTRAASAEKEAHKYKDRWDKLKDSAKERKKREMGGANRGPLESVKE